MLGRIHTRIERELGFQKELMKLRGALDMTLAQVSAAVFDIVNRLMLINIVQAAMSQIVETA